MLYAFCSQEAALPIACIYIMLRGLAHELWTTQSYNMFHLTGFSSNCSAFTVGEYMLLADLITAFKCYIYSIVARQYQGPHCGTERAAGIIGFASAPTSRPDACCPT